MVIWSKGLFIQYISWDLLNYALKVRACDLFHFLLILMWLVAVWPLVFPIPWFFFSLSGFWFSIWWSEWYPYGYLTKKLICSSHASTKIEKTKQMLRKMWASYHGRENNFGGETTFSKLCSNLLGFYLAFWIVFLMWTVNIFCIYCI
jgi:hypothetical protein